MIKKIIALTAASLMSIATVFTSFAGTWTNTAPTDTWVPEGNNIWFYIKDDGQYAHMEWIQDTDGSWYYLSSLYSLPQTPGTDANGYIYNDSGIYVDTTGKRYVTLNDLSSINKDMSYDQVVAILGEPHETRASKSVAKKTKNTGGGLIELKTYRWYTQDGKTVLDVTFREGVVSKRTWSNVSENSRS